jgi:hypothetical protein
MTPKTELRDPFDIMLNRFQKQFPDPDKNSPEWISFVESVRAGGVRESVDITEDGQLIHGRKRWLAARTLKIELPCTIRDDCEAALILVESLIHCRHMTRGAALYMVLPLMDEFIKAANTRRLANLRKGKNSEIPLIGPKGSTLSFETIADLCARFGVTTEVFKRAQEVRAAFDADAELKAVYEPQLLSGEKNLWNVLSAAGGADADQTQRTFGVLKKLFKSDYGKHWTALSKAQRAELLQQWRDDAAELPEDMREAIADALMEVAA